MGLKWRLGYSADVITEYGGTVLSRFLRDPRTVVEATVRARETLAGVLGAGVNLRPAPAAHGFLESEALGAQVEWPEDSWPAPRAPILKEPDDIENLELVTDFMSRPSTAVLRDMRSYMEKHVGKGAGYLHEGHIGNGHITTARNLRGDQIFIDLYERPAWCHRLFEFLTENHILCTQDLWRYQGIKQPEFFHIADDFAGMIQPKLFEEFALPYWKRSFEVLGKGCADVELHSEVMHTEHLPLLRKLPITMVDYGQDPFVTVEEARRTGFKVSWHFKDLEVLTGTPESIESLYRSYADSGLEFIVVSFMHRRTPVENMRALLNIARRCE